MDAEQFQDQVLNCVECLSPFLFSAQDQAYFKEQGFDTPRRCKDCRQKRKVKQARSKISESGLHYIAVCAECGQETTVPFKPQPTRPIFCSSCHLKRRRS